ncbi:MAG: hypothetical protein ACJ76H_07925 [Bacteriovoracaceae bacterium]
MKYITLLLVFCFSLNAFASTGAMKELESAMDEYQYALTVDWDQKDESFKAAQTEALSKKMGELFKQGLTSQDVNFLIDTRFKNSKVAEAAKLKLSLMGNSLTPSNVLDVLKNNSSDVYSQGAAWSGDIKYFVWGGVVVAIVAIAVAYSQWQNKNYTCTQTAMADYCTDRYSCDDYGCDYEYTDCGSYERCIKEERNDL